MPLLYYLGAHHMVDSNDWLFVIFLLILLIYHVFTSLLYYLGAHHMVDSNDWSFVIFFINSTNIPCVHIFAVLFRSSSHGRFQ